MSKGVCELLTWESDSQVTSPCLRVPTRRRESKESPCRRGAGSSPPGGGPSPPGHPVVNGWRRDERPRDRPQRLLCSLVSSAKPTTGVQVVGPAAPTSASTRSLRMPAALGHPCLSARFRQSMSTPSGERPSLSRLDRMSRDSSGELGIDGTARDSRSGQTSPQSEVDPQTARDEQLPAASGATAAPTDTSARN
jgi:hypothetical protein